MEHRKSGNSQSQRSESGRADKKVEQDRKLNETLKDSFPASDPPSTGQATGREKPKSRIDRPPAPVIVPDVEPEPKRS